MGLSLVVGPAHAGKIAHLLERQLESLAHDPWLVVPNRSDVERIERELLERRPALLGGRVATFDDLFETVAARDPNQRPAASGAERSLLVRRAVARAALNGLSASAASSGFSDSLGSALGELGAGLVDPNDLEGDLAELARAFHDELDRAGLWDRAALRRAAVELLHSDLGAWSGSPVFAYGFEDLTAAEWGALEALSARTEVTVSLPYEPGRVAFASLGRTASDLSRLAGPRITELPAASDRHLPPALAHLERSLYEERPERGPVLDGAIRFLEGAGARGTAELVGEELASLIRAGTPAGEIAIVCESIERWRAPLETVLGSLELPYAFEEPVRLGQTPYGAALLSLLRFAWLGSGRAELFRFLRSPFSGLQRSSVDFVEGRLRGRAVRDPARVEEEAEKLRGGPIPYLAGLREPGTPIELARSVARALLTSAHGLLAPPTGDEAVADLRAGEAVVRTLDELARLESLDGQTVTQDELVGTLERATVRLPGVGEQGRIAVLDLPRVRTRRFDVVVLLGLDEGALPRRGSGSPFLGDELRHALGGRLEQPDPVSRDRYVFYTACTRPRRRLVLVREAATDEGVPRQASPFWDEVTTLFRTEDVARATKRRPLSALTWPLEQAPSDRERLRALMRSAVDDEDGARDLAASNGWSRKLARALAAWHKPTELRAPAVLDWLGNRTSFGVTELERFADCSSAWLVERVIDPKKVDAEPDPMLRGSIAHTALNRFSQAVPKELGVDRVADADEEAAVALMRRCLDDALASGVRLELTELQHAELHQTLLRDLEGFVLDEAASELALVPRRFEVGFGSDRAAPELQRGLPFGDGLTLSGKIDRIDVDPFSARGIVQDYKSGRAPSASEIDRELRLQIPLYLLVLRDLAGIEPIGGVYRSLSGRRATRGILRASAEEDLPGFTSADYLDEDAFWAHIETARDRASTYAERIRSGDVRHDPKGDGCPAWCDLWPICRVERS